MDAQTQQALSDFSREIRRLQGQVDTLSRAARTPQLAHSSLEQGQALEVRDENGNVRRRWGWIDGAVGEVTEGGDPVDAPSAPSVTPSLGGLRVTWDGLLAGDVAIPVDFDHMAVHVSTSSGFTPSAATYVNGIRRAGEGGMLPVVPLPYVEHYVRLVPVTTGGVQGVPSAEVAATPLQTSGVDLQADSVDAVHIKAGAVEADKLEALLVLASTIIGGIPGGARVEIDQDGLRGYDESNALIFAVDATGNAVFSGDIVASEITGSRMVIGAAPGNIGTIEDSDGVVRARVVSSGGQRAQLAATNTQAEFSAWGDSSSPTTPVGAMLAASGICQLVLRSNAAAPTTSPVASLSALADQTYFSARAGSGSEVVIQSLPDYSSILLAAPPAVDPDDAQGSGYIFAQRYDNDIAAVSMQSPVWSSDDPAEPALRSMLHLTGTRPESPHAEASYSAHRHLFQQQYNMDTDGRDASDGVVEVASTHSILAPRHQPAQSSFLAQPSFATSGSFVDFTGAQWPSISFRTSWSGWTRITVQTAGINHASDFSSFATGFRLSGGSSVPAALSRCAYIRSRGAGKSEPMPETAVFHLQLVGATDYTLTPAWRISSGSSSTAAYYPTLDNTITVEPLT